jgi:hypothetical protein
MYAVKFPVVSLGDLIVSVLAIRPSFSGINPAEVDRLLREIKIRSTTSYGEEVKPSIPYREILLHVKLPY